MKERTFRFPQVMRLLTVVVFMVWSVLPAVCATMCVSRVCCKSASDLVGSPKSSCSMCEHCKPGLNRELTSSKQGNVFCCKWIASRVVPLAQGDHAAFCFDSLAVLPSEFPRFTAEAVFSAGSIPGYSGLAPPRPPAFLPADRGPPIA